MNWKSRAQRTSRQIGALVASVTLAMACGAAPVRVTTMDLRPSAAVGTTGWTASFQENLLGEAAATLTEIKPDVILLQDVSGWKTCEQLAKALRPLEYHVDICSAFRDAQTGELIPHQAAILSRHGAYLSWPTGWRSEGGTGGLSGGCVFAAIKIEGHNVGFFSTLFGDDSNAKSGGARLGREAAATQLSGEIARLGSWTTNRLESFVIGGDFNTTRDDPALSGEQTLACIESMGFENAFDDAPHEERITLPANSRRPGATVDYIFNKGGRAAGRAVISRGALAEHCAVTAAIDFSLPPLPKVRKALASGGTDAKTGWRSSLGPMTIGATGVLAMGLVVVFARRRRTSNWQLARTTSGSSVADPRAGTLVMSPEERQGMVAEIGRWAKQQIVQRLVSDRSELIETQERAASKVRNVDERLSQIESQIQNRRAEYEERIDELLKELTTARAENRELIENRIAALKAQMGKEHAKA